MFRGLDIHTIKWATGGLLEECRFLLNTQLVYLKKEKDPTSKQFDDDEWIRSLTEAQEVTIDIPEDRVTYEQQEVDPQKVRLIQMEESLRKYVSRRLLALSEGEIAALTTAMRQIGVGSQGGADALAICHQLLFDEGAEGSLTEPLARIKVHENNCFGTTEWKAVREAASRFLPKHTVAWNIEACLTLSKTAWCQCPKIVVQNKETSTAPWSAAWLWEWWRPKHGVRQPSVDWC